MDRDEIKYLAALLQLPKMNQNLLTAMVDYCGSPHNAWKNHKFWSKVPGISNSAAEEMSAGKRSIDPDRLLEYIDHIGAKIVTIHDKEYPAIFREVAQPPYLLYYYGTLPENNRFGITIIGSRKCSNYGLEVAEKISYDLVKKAGTMIVNGIAEGIDAAALEGALKANGYAVAVLGCGIDKVYPTINAPLYKRLKKTGCLISEFPLGGSPLRQNFPLRNRLMSALGNGVLVVEAHDKSGVFHTVDHALDQGKDVFAVPGSIFSRGSYAPHYFIREGCAKLVVSADDILEEYFDLNDLNEVKVVERDFSEYEEIERKVFDALKEKPLAFDDIMLIMKKSAAEVSVYLTKWDIDGIVHKSAGELYALYNYYNEVNNE